MPSDLTVSRVAAAAALPGERAAAPALPEVPKPASPATTALPNPSLRLDPGLAMVVIEFRDDSGTVRASIPSQQQLDAYRAWERGHAGATPHPGAAQPQAATTVAMNPPSPPPSPAAPPPPAAVNGTETGPG